MSLLCVSVLCASLVTQPAEEHTLAPAVTKDDKQAALNAAVVAGVRWIEGPKSVPPPELLVVGEGSCCLADLSCS